MDKQHPKDNMIAIEVSAQNEGLCKVGIPFPCGKVTSLTQIKLTQNNQVLESYAQPLSHWQDGSIKWANIGFFHESSALDQYELQVLDALEQKNAAHTSGLQLCEHESQLTISANEHQFIIDLKTLSLNVKTAHQPLVQIASLAGTLLQNNDRRPLTSQLNHWHSHSLSSLNSTSNSVIELKLEGHFEGSSGREPLQFTTCIEFHSLTPLVKIQTTLHNPNPASHPQGLWDLGDNGSEFFDAFVFNLELAENNNIEYQTTPYAAWHTANAHTKITQYASGGKNWKSPAHVDKDNLVTLKQNGFEVAGKKTKSNSEGRATPSLYSSNGIGISIEKFWQNFPSSVDINKNSVQIELFPTITGASHELQGGEKKTHTFWLNFSDQRNALHWIHTPPVAKPSVGWLTKYAALPTLSTLSTITKTDPIAELINAGLTHKNNFFSKREAIDEYGWRNFGDLYADHETWNRKSEGLFISHYNNQYDPIYGFLRQYLLTGNSRWFELADDLARHVKDIDIYHTQLDKAEYNGGLFWHTDHYLDAFTATHRTFSKLQGSDPYAGRTSGGGPGGQHCYTTGLAYHYLLTGAEDSKQAVFTLEKWITLVYEGKNTCCELLLAFKNRHAAGRKNHFNGQYPFDRGTGYYITTLLDCYQLTQEQNYLSRVEDIIRNTIHPLDNINDRDLSNIEACWFYTVFLQSVCRFLDTKEAGKSYDEGFYYARDALIHYVDWMLSNEYPYLEKPEVLEYPNDTWTAQELRKTHILASAYYYSSGSNKEYLDKAKYFQDYVAAKLSTSSERSYTRILVLLMQNHGALAYYESKISSFDFEQQKKAWPKANYQQEAPNIIASLLKELGKRLLKLSIINEISWLKMRLKR